MWWWDHLGCSDRAQVLLLPHVFLELEIGSVKKKAEGSKPEKLPSREPLFVTGKREKKKSSDTWKAGKVGKPARSTNC
jgi:hypothetical protein